MAILEETAHNRPGSNDQRDHRRESEEKREFHSPVLSVHCLLVLAGTQKSRYRRKKDRPEPYSDHSKGELVHPVGIIDVRDRALAEEIARKSGRDDEVHLDSTRTDCRWQDQFHQSLHVGINARKPRSQRNAGSAAGNKEPRELQYAADGYGKRLHSSGLRGRTMKGEETADHCDVEKDR